MLDKISAFILFLLIFTVWTGGCGNGNNPISPSLPTSTPTPSWQLLGNTTFGCYGYNTVSVQAFNGMAYLAFQDGSYKDLVMSYSYNGWTTLGDSELPPASSYTSQLVNSNGTLYLLAEDATVGPWYSLFGFNGASWVTVGNADFYKSVVPANTIFSCAFNQNNVPYLAVQDAGNQYKATLLQYNGSGWADVGSAGFSPVTINSLSLAFSGTIPYVAFSDFNNSYAGSVMSYNGSWSYVGSPDFTGSNASPLLVINNGIPYVAFFDTAAGGKISVMEFNGVIWKYLGPQGFSIGAPYALSFCISNGIPYIAYSDLNNSGIVTVMDYVGDAWQTVGTPSTPAMLLSGSPGIYVTSISVDNGTPYVGFQNPHLGIAGLLVYK